MRLITQRDNLANLAEFYRSKYQGPDGGWRQVFSHDDGRWVSTEDNYKNILTCGTNPTPEQVAAIGLSQSWYIIICDECTAIVESAIEIASNATDDGCTPTQLCVDCFAKAVGLMNTLIERSTGEH